MLGAIIGHLCGDFLLQNDWMALNKKKPGRNGQVACSTHCILWTASVLTFSLTWSFWAMVILYWSHYLQDRTNIIRRWMSLIGQEQFATGPLSPWSVIVVDQVWHVLTIHFIWTVLKL